MMVTSGLEKCIFKSLNAGRLLFMILHKTPPFNEVKCGFCMGKLKKKSSPLFTIIFRLKIVILDTDSILNVKMIVVSQPYSVLRIECIL